MSKVDWFRRSTWTGRDREEFNARLQRERAPAPSGVGRWEWRPSVGSV